MYPLASSGSVVTRETVDTRMAAPRSSDSLGLELGCCDRPCQPVTGTYGRTWMLQSGGGIKGVVSDMVGCGLHGVPLSQYK